MLSHYSECILCFLRAHSAAATEKQIKIIMLKIGPAGNTNEYDGWSWNEKDKDGVAQIFISHGDRIHSLQFQFVENGTLVLSDKHGQDGSPPYAPKFSVVSLNYPSELITHISGYSGARNWQGGVTSIIFTTNKAVYGPFGCSAGNDIAFDYEIGRHNKICGFHGNAENYLNSFGIYMKPMTTLSNVNNLTGKEHGTDIGPNYPLELITHISGYSGVRNAERGVTSIIFTTNKAAYGPFGCSAGNDIKFDYEIGRHNKICGFYGTAGNYLNSFGVYMKPMTTLNTTDRKG
ncbi:hypothetical protein Vadar_002034 [Vaccinium darrowii]|uniref:Uncharacterized protein n=1 Tax=Vaccinium darrowii TaxID=229202 RepID=A0ACB7XNP7_9ERIC|nr:hypothetical protein Vadar_002034 [Vaccinium darrowii]